MNIIFSKTPNLKQQLDKEILELTKLLKEAQRSGLSYQVYSIANKNGNIKVVASCRENNKLNSTYEL